jgi:hypothetical protein
MKEGSRKLVVIAPRTSSNVYILDIKEEEECYMSQVDESWLWHKIMGHLSFKNMIKSSRKEAMKDMPKIIKPFDPVCKHCQLRK